MEQYVTQFQLFKPNEINSSFLNLIKLEKNEEQDEFL